MKNSLFWLFWFFLSFLIFGSISHVGWISPCKIIFCILLSENSQNFRLKKTFKLIVQYYFWDKYIPYLCMLFLIDHHSDTSIRSETCDVPSGWISDFNNIQRICGKGVYAIFGASDWSHTAPIRQLWPCLLIVILN